MPASKRDGYITRLMKSFNLKGDVIAGELCLVKYRMRIRRWRTYSPLIEVKRIAERLLKN